MISRKTSVFTSHPRRKQCGCWAHFVDRDDRGITMRRFVDRHSARHLIDMRAMLCLDRSMRAMLRYVTILLGLHVNFVCLQRRETETHEKMVKAAGIYC